MPIPDPTALIAPVPVIPVLTIERLADAVPLARALAAGGLSVIEVTLRTPAALDAVRAIVAEVPQCGVGVGTVTRGADAAAAGCATVSEAMALAEHGFKVLKFFPAEAAGGVSWLKAVAAPLADLKFCPTGGIDLRNAVAYLALANVIAVGGSWPAPTEAMAAGDFSRIATLAREAAQLRRRR